MHLPYSPDLASTYYFLFLPKTDNFAGEKSACKPRSSQLFAIGPRVSMRTKKTGHI